MSNDRVSTISWPRKLLTVLFSSDPRDAHSRSPLSGIALWPTAGPSTTSQHLVSSIVFCADLASSQETENLVITKLGGQSASGVE